MATRPALRTSLSAAAVLVCAAGAHAQVLRADVLARVGEPIPGSGTTAIQSLSFPGVAGNGNIGFGGLLAGGIPFVAYEGQLVFRADDLASPVITTFENTMGVGANGQYVFSPQVDGLSAAWSNQGLIIARDTPAPELPIGNILNISRPAMSDDGTAFFHASVRWQENGSNVTQTAIYSAAQGQQPELRVAGGQTIDGFTLSLAGVGNVFDASNNGQRLVFRGALPPPDNRFLLIADGDVKLIQNQPTGSEFTENWTQFKFASINNSGSWVAAAVTSNVTSLREVIVYNGRIVARGSSVIGGGFIDPTVANAVHIDDQDRIVLGYASGTGASRRAELYAGQGALLPARGRLVARIGTELDTDGDGSADHTLTDIVMNTTLGPSVRITNDGYVVFPGSITPLNETEATAVMLRVPLPYSVRCPADWDASGAVNTADITAYLSDWFVDRAAGTVASDFTGDGAVTTADITAFLSAWFAARASGC